jgi:hypothetical protein
MHEFDAIVDQLDTRPLEEFLEDGGLEAELDAFLTEVQAEAEAPVAEPARPSRPGRISRPHKDSTQADLHLYLRALGRALEAEGVDYGDPFYVVSARKLKEGRYDLDAHNDDMVGAAASSTASADAAIFNFPKSGNQRHRLLMFAFEAGERGITSDEAHQALGIPLQSAKPRLLELRKGGWLRFTGATRPSLAGASVEVMAVTSQATEALGTGPISAPLPTGLSHTKGGSR